MRVSNDSKSVFMSAKNEAFARVFIDAQLKEQGWDVKEINNLDFVRIAVHLFSLKKQLTCTAISRTLRCGRARNDNSI
ncbi:MAG: hypothetical protein A4E19_00715 [Nitrospira sp. SG-bin1]|nr:MAG: hypothetical protein A4E19_00715 [Nitrospira sp. SG-bin1]